MGIAAPYTGAAFENSIFTNQNVEASFAKVFGVESSVNAEALFELRDGEIKPTSNAEGSGVNIPFPAAIWIPTWMLRWSLCEFSYKTFSSPAYFLCAPRGNR